MNYSLQAAPVGDGRYFGPPPRIPSSQRPSASYGMIGVIPLWQLKGRLPDVSDETALVQLARAGDLKAFSDLIQRYEGKIFRLALHITQNREDAEDVLQEAFLKSYEHLDQFQGNSKFYTWIVRIAVNQALMKLRKRKSDRSVSLDEGIDTGEDTVTREIATWDENPGATVHSRGIECDPRRRDSGTRADLPHGVRAAGR